MFSQEQMHELLSFEGNGEGVVSVYLDTDSTRQSAEAVKLLARGLLKEVQPNYDKDAETIERYLDLGYDWSKPGLALFSSKGGSFFRAYTSPVAFRNRIRLGNRPYVKPLAHLLDHYAHFGVILVDRVNGRFFEYHLGELQASDAYKGEEIRKQKIGSGSSAVGRRGGTGSGRHEEEIALRNLRECAAAAGRFYADRPIRRLFLGGTSETTALFKDMLPKQLLSCLVGTFAMDIETGESEVRRYALQQLSEVNAQREMNLVERMIDLNAMGANAVVGLDDTLQAVSDKRVETLVISDGFRTPGFVHNESGFLIANLARSPLAEGELSEVTDVVDAAVIETVSQGGHVEIIADNPNLDAVGRIGAILRF